MLNLHPFPQIVDSWKFTYLMFHFPKLLGCHLYTKVLGFTPQKAKSHLDIDTIPVIIQ